MAASTPLTNRAKFTLSEIVAATHGDVRHLASGAELQDEVLGVSTDTRTITADALFIALRGDRVDGHSYLAEAAQRGARVALVEKAAMDKVKDAPTQLTLIQVRNTLHALGALGAAHRRRFNIQLVAVTGSYGKTTTRAMIAAALSPRFKVLSSQENFNNEIGVPQTLLQLDEMHSVAVIEIAMRGTGQIEYLARIAQPTIGVITNVGPQHIELLGSIENIAAAKAEVLRFLPPDGAAVLPADDEYLDFFTDQVAGRVVRFGRNPSAEYCVNHVVTETDGNISVTIHNPKREIRNLRLPLPGAHNAVNAAAALAVAGVLDVPLEEAGQALEGVEVPGGRMRVLRNEARGLTIIDDCYNAGPSSMQAALTTLRDLPEARRRVAVLGAMKELGDSTTEEHASVGALAAHCADLIIGVGLETKVLLEQAREIGTIPFHEEWCEDAACAARKVLDWVRDGDVILVKGSRSVGLEVVVKALAGDE